MKNRNIYEILSDIFKKKSEERKELKKIPRYFWLNLNYEDYIKFKDSYPKNNELCLSFLYLRILFKSVFYLFILYIIGDFMDYEKLILLITGGLKILGHIPLTFWAICFLIFLFVDLLNEEAVKNSRNKHALTFYKRSLKKKK